MEENIEMVEQVKNIFINYYTSTTLTANNQTPKPAPSEQSTASNPSVSISYNNHPQHYLLSPPLIYTQQQQQAIEEKQQEDEDEDDNDDDQETDDHDEDDDDDLDDEDDEDDDHGTHVIEAAAAAGEPPSELMQVDMSETIRLGSPEHDQDTTTASTNNNLMINDTHFRDLLLSVSKVEGAKSTRGVQQQGHGCATTTNTLQQPLVLPTGT